jgi:ribonuclease HI/exonuclease III
MGQADGEARVQKNEKNEKKEKKNTSQEAPPYSSSGVAIGVRSGWAIEREERHPSGRAIGVVVSKGGFKVALVCLYMPSGLDGLPPTSPRCLMATELLEFTTTFITEYSFFVIGGDLNETRLPSLDRRMGGAGLDPRKPGTPYQHSPLDILLRSTPRVADLYRELHPVGHELAQNFTRYDPNRDSTSASRIDYILVPAESLQPTNPTKGSVHWSCEVLELRREHSDHCVVMATVRDPGGTRLPGRHQGPRRAWSPDHPDISRADSAQRSEVFTACNAAADRMLTRWITQDRHDPLVGTEDQRRRLEQRAQSLQHALKAEANKILGTQGGSRRRGIHIETTLGRARALVSAWERLGQTLKEIRLGCLRADSDQHKSALGMLQGLLPSTQVLPSPESVRELACEVERKLPLARTSLEQAWELAPDGVRGRNSVSECFASDEGEFIKQYVKGEAARTPPISNATIPHTGKKSFNPRVYKPIVRKLVMGPMNHKVTLRGRRGPMPTGSSHTAAKKATRVDSTDVRDTNAVPFWWDKFYDRRAKGIPSEAFAELMTPATPSEIRSAIVGAEGHKSPGPDGCSIDLFKLLTGPDPTLTAANPPSQGLVCCRCDLERPRWDFSGSQLKRRGKRQCVHCLHTKKPRHTRAPGTTSTLQAVVEISNLCMVLGHIPPCLKEGWITLVPKVKADGSFSTEADKMRPITVLPELGKITSRVLAKRLGDILTRNPDFLAKQQRGFIADGCVEQGVAVLVDVIEDWRAGKMSKDHSLFIISYDQKKAYDSVQLFTLRASLERFNTPEIFIQLVLSSLTDAHSRVRTFDGLTDRFLLKSSVRQGDPLAPLLYALVTDALHAGLENNPLFPETAKEGGYTFRAPGPDGSAVRVCSSGYADDTAIVASDPARLYEMHEWVRDFYGAHCFAFNCTKTKLLCSNVRWAPPIFSVDGRSRVTPSNAKSSFRYLGVDLNLSLNWKLQQQRMHRTVWLVCERIRRHRFDLPMSKAATQQFLLPRLRSGLLFADVKDSKLKRWDIMLRKAVAEGAAMQHSCARSWLSTEAFYLGTRIPRLVEHAKVLRLEELMVTLNAEYPSSQTARSRLESEATRPVPILGANPDPRPRCRTGQHMRSLLWATVSESEASARSATPRKLRAATETVDPGAVHGHQWRPSLAPFLHRMRAAGQHGFLLYHTDGSTGKAKGLPSGSAVILATVEGKILLEHGFPVRASGNNHLAELCAIVSAIVMTPEDQGVRIWTDSQSCIDAINHARDRDSDGNFANRYHLPQRKRILSAARPVMNNLRSLITARTGAIALTHVRAHSGGTDLHSRLNDSADRVANAARLEGMHEPIPYNLHGEERMIMTLTVGSGTQFERHLPVVGSYRAQLWREARMISLRRLQADECPDDERRVTQGFLARSCGPALLAYLDTIHRARTASLTRFATEVIAQWLPCEAVLAMRSQDRDGACLLCRSGAQESAEHAICQCPHPAPARARALAVAAGMAILERPRSPNTELDSRQALDLGPGMLIPAWFDPSGTHAIRVCPQVPQAALAALRGHPPLAGFLGILPSDLDEVLVWEYGTDGLWRRRTLSDTQELMAAVQGELVWGGLRVWSARCNALRRWWRTDAAKDVRMGVVERASQRAYARALRQMVRRAAQTGPSTHEHNLRVKPRQFDPGTFISTTLAEEAAAETAFRMSPQPPPPPCY